MTNHHRSNPFRYLAALLLAGAVALLAACGGGDGDAVTINTQPMSQSVESGSSATFSVDASGVDLDFKWQVSTDAGVSYTDISGANQSTYTTPPLTIENDGSLYRVIVSNAFQTLTSEAATLSVYVPAEPLSSGT